MVAVGMSERPSSLPSSWLEEGSGGDGGGGGGDEKGGSGEGGGGDGGGANEGGSDEGGGDGGGGDSGDGEGGGGEVRDGGSHGHRRKSATLLSKLDCASLQKASASPEPKIPCCKSMSRKQRPQFVCPSERHEPVPVFLTLT